MPQGRQTMIGCDGNRDGTAFPATPGDVAILTIQEFMFDIYDVDGIRAPSLDHVRRIFMEDANRVLVWWIRFGALKTWCASSMEGIEGATDDSAILRDAYELAAGFPLNPFWEFDATAFGYVVQTMADKRARAAAAGVEFGNSGEVRCVPRT
jgi:hypothetical protein